jgi:hypothetical protein
MALDALETLRLFMYYSVENTPNGTYSHYMILLNNAATNVKV